MIDNEEIRRLQHDMYGDLIIKGALNVPEGHCFVLNGNRAELMESRTLAHSLRPPGRQAITL
jgi:hypothetical protein